MASKSKKKNKSRIKIKVPKIQFTKTGRRFIMISKKKVYIAEDITPNQLLKFILSRILPKTKARKSTTKKQKSEKTVISQNMPAWMASVSRGDAIARVNENIIRDQKIDQEHKAIENKIMKKINHELLTDGTNRNPNNTKVYKSGNKLKYRDQNGKEYEIEHELAQKIWNEIEAREKAIQTIHQEYDKEFAQQQAELNKIKRETKEEKQKRQQELTKNLIDKTQELDELKAQLDNTYKSLKSTYDYKKLRKLATDRGILKKNSNFNQTYQNIKSKTKKEDQDKLYKNMMFDELVKLKALDTEEVFKDDANIKKAKQEIDKTEKQIKEYNSKLNKLSINVNDLTGDEQLGVESNNDDTPLPPLITAIPEASPTIAERLDQIEQERQTRRQSFNESLERAEELSDNEISDQDESEEQEGEGKRSKRTTSGGLYTSQIDAMMRHHIPNYLGTIAANEVQLLIPLIKDQRQLAFIQNTDPNYKKGKHWVAWFIDRDRKTIEYFDSLAKKLPKDLYTNIQPLIQRLSKGTYKFKYNLVPDQDADTSTCGYFAMTFIKDRFNGVPFKVASHYTSEKRMKEVIKNTKHRFHYIDGMTGDGWKDTLKSAWGTAKKIGGKIFETGKKVVKTIIDTKPREGWSPKIRKILEKEGHKMIKNITLYRQPIQSFLTKVLNVVSFGQFKKNLQSAGYDNAMHLYMIITLDDGTSLRVDKNHVIEFQYRNKPSDGAEAMPVGSKSISLNEFFNKGIDHAGKEKYFVYDSKTQNCQWFVIWNLQANGLLNSTIRSWVLQDAESIYKNLGLLERINKGITDFAAKADTWMYGAGNKRASG